MVLRFIQVLDALDFGDAVSNQVIKIHQMLLEKGEKSEIFSKYADHRVEKYRQHIFDFVTNEDAIIIHHFSGYSELADEISNLRGYKILIYHNITPHSFFKRGAQLYEFCKKGRIQLQQIIGRYNLILGDSIFNCQEVESLGAKEVKELPIIVTDFSHIPVDKLLANTIRSDFEKVWLFVGRIAPNKRQDLLIDIFASYIKLYREEKHHLYLVGKYFEDDVYYKNICSKINTLGLQNQVTLVGKVEDAELPTYFKVADLFLCMSEHEGFCVPLVEAFHNKVPVVAYARTAVAATMGGGKGVLNTLDIEAALNLIHSVFTDSSLKTELINHGIKQTIRFTPETVRQQLYSIIDGIKAVNHDKYPLTVSVVICTYNRSDYLQRCLNYLKDQDYLHFEVIVVNGPSTDGTINILSARTDIKVIQNSKRNLSISRNLGIQHASGDIVAFIDDDALPYDNWIYEIVKRYNEVPKNVVGVGGRTFFANKLFFQFEAGITDSFGNAVHISECDFRLSDSSYYKYLHGTNSSFLRKALIDVKGFDEQYDYFLDETDLAVRLQQKDGLVVNANQAYVRHEFAQSHNRLGKYNFNWFVIAKNTAYFGIKNGAKNSSLYKIILVTSKNIFKERCLSFFSAWRNKELSLQEASYYSYRTIIGTLRGYYDSCFTRKLGQNLENADSPFLPYLVDPNGEEIMEENIDNKNKLHILIISQEFPPHSFGGIGAYNQTLTKELMQMGHDVTVISRGPNDCTNVIGPLTHIQVAAVEYFDSIPEYPILSKNLAWARKAAQIAKEIHKKHPISVIESALWDFEAIGILMLRPEFKVPLIVRLVTPLLVSIKMNGWQMNDDFRICAELEKELIGGADAVIGISNSIKESVVTTYNINPDRRWLVQPLGVQPWAAYTNVSNYGELPKDLNRGQIQILFVGRLESRKGINIFLQALKIVMPKNPDIFVWIAGADIEGWKEKASDILNQDALSRVQFLGMVDEEKRELLYANCDFLVFPSRYESFGLVPLEVMVHGKPVIGAKAASIPEVIIEGECGLLFEPDNYKDLAQKIITLVEDGDLRKRLAQGAKKRVQVLSARNMAKASVEVYHSLLNSELHIQTLNHPIIKRFKDHLISSQKVSDCDVSQNSTSSNIKSNELQSTSPVNTSFDVNPNWDVTKPTIISWKFLNKIINRYIVPKAVKFIQSVLFDSMQKQTYFNNLVISRNQVLEKEVVQLRKLISNKFSEVEQEFVASKENIEKYTKTQITKYKQELEMIEKQNIELLATYFKTELSKIKESNEIKNQQLFNGFVDIKNMLSELQNLTLIENEISRSEFSFRLNTQTKLETKIINKEKVDASLNNLRLNLGCGHIIMPDYINVDQREMPDVDVISNINDLPFSEGSVSEIFSSHVIEHFSDFEIRKHILPYWYKLLNESGKIVIICPDAESMISEYIKGNYSWDNLRKVTYGGQDYGGNYHYNMFTPESLRQILLDTGFNNVNIIETKRVNGLCYEMEIHGFK
jgi:glycosyltransferase involved in cell wall biosynthesis/predicted SAM-dependent methyltransferase